MNEDKPHKDSLKWEEMAAAARSIEPPSIDVRQSVRDRLERDIALGWKRPAPDSDEAATFFDDLLGIFAGALPRFALGTLACLSAVFAVSSIASLEETDADSVYNDVSEDFIDAYANTENWSEWL